MLVGHVYAAMHLDVFLHGAPAGLSGLGRRRHQRSTRVTGIGEALRFPSVKARTEALVQDRRP